MAINGFTQRDRLVVLSKTDDAVRHARIAGADDRIYEVWQEYANPGDEFYVTSVPEGHGSVLWHDSFNKYELALQYVMNLVAGEFAAMRRQAIEDSDREHQVTD